MLKYILTQKINIKNVIDNNPNDLTNFIFGDIYHPSVINESTNFINKNINKNINKIIMEISSRKVVYYNDIPLNYIFLQIFHFLLNIHPSFFLQVSCNLILLINNYYYI